MAEKRVPNAIQLLVVPITTIVITGGLALAIIGPVTRHLGDLLTQGIVMVYEAAPAVGAFLFGALYAPLVITGMHHMFIAVDLQLITQNGGNVHLADDRPVQHRPGKRGPRHVLARQKRQRKEHGFHIGLVRLFRDHGAGDVRCEPAA